MNLTSYVQDRQLTIALRGEIDHHAAREIMQALSAKIDLYLPLRCILDFRDVTFMDSSGIAVVIHTLRRMNTLQGRLLLQNIPPQPYKVLRAAGMQPMKSENYMNLEFPSRSANEAFARSAIACFAAQLDPTLDELGDIKTAVSEAVTNCIVHAYPETIGPVILRARLLPDNVLDIMVKDRGCGIADLEQACRPMFTTGGEGRSGMGITIMESFMTEFRISSVPGKGTTVHMKRRIVRRGGKK